VCAWCGPQPNSRLLLNYGIVDESNPYDKLQLTVTLPAVDPMYKVKRGILQVSCMALIMVQEAIMPLLREALHMT